MALIDREVLLRTLAELGWLDDTILDDIINEIPTVDAKPVRNSHWFLLDECSNEGVYCSACHKKVYKTDYANQKLKSPFCPNCGASMTKDLVSNKYTMELVWHSCTSYLPKEDYNPCLYVTNGNEVFPVVWKRDPEWQRFISDNWYIEPGVNSDGIWWADLAQTVKGFEPLQHLT